MGRKCLTCSHPKKDEINQAILNNVPYRAIAKKYKISHMSIVRHVLNGHIAKDLIHLHEVKKIAYSENLLEKLMYLQEEALKVLIKAREPQEGPPLLNTILAAIGKAAALLETQAKLAGQIREQKWDLSVNPTWIMIKNELFTALQPYPQALSKIESIIPNDNNGLPEYQDITPAVKEIIDKEFAGEESGEQSKEQEKAI